VELNGLMLRIIAKPRIGRMNVMVPAKNFFNVWRTMAYNKNIAKKSWAEKNEPYFMKLYFYYSVRNVACLVQNRKLEWNTAATLKISFVFPVLFKSPQSEQNKLFVRYKFISFTLREFGSSVSSMLGRWKGEILYLLVNHTPSLFMNHSGQFLKTHYLIFLGFIRIRNKILACLFLKSSLNYKSPV